MSVIINPGTSGGGSGTVTSVVGGVGITNTPEPIVGAGTVDLDINSLAAESVLSPGDFFPFVDIDAAGTPIAQQRKVTFANLLAAEAAAGDFLAQYLLLTGRTGATNNPLISLDDDATITGSGVIGKSLHILGEAGTGGLHFDKNAFGKTRLLSGEQFDPFTAFVPGGILDFAVISEGGIGTLFGGFHAGSSGGVTFFGVSSQGTIAAPTASLDEDTLFKIAALGFDSTNTLTGNEVGTIAITCKPPGGVPVAGFVSGQMTFMTTDTSGTTDNRVEIHDDGSISFGPLSNGFQVSAVGNAQFSAIATADEPAVASPQVWFNSDTKTYRGRIDPNTVTFVTVIDAVSLPGQTADVGDTNFAGTGTTGLYRIEVYLVDTAADLTAGAITAHIKFNDGSAAHDVTVGPVVLTTLGAFAQATIFARRASANITYGVTHTGIFGTATYAVYATAERLA